MWGTQMTGPLQEHLHQRLEVRLTVFRAFYKLLLLLWPNGDGVLAVLPGVGHGNLALMPDIEAGELLLQYWGALFFPEDHGGSEGRGRQGPWERTGRGMVSSGALRVRRGLGRARW